MPTARILHHGRRPRPAHIRPLTRRGMLELAERLCLHEADEAELIDDDPEQARHLDELARRALVMSMGEVA